MGQFLAAARRQAPSQFRHAQSPAVLSAITLRICLASSPRVCKFEVWSRAAPGLDSLAACGSLMLAKEAHHRFVGEKGVGRIIQRTCEVKKENKVEDPSDVRALGVIDLPTIQKYLNFHYSV